MERAFQIEAGDNLKAFVLMHWPSAATVYFWCDPVDVYGPPEISGIFDIDDTCLWVSMSRDSMRLTLQQYVDQIRNPSCRESVVLVQHVADPELYVFDLQSWPPSH